MKALDNGKKNINTILPQLPFSSYIVGAKKSGKTTLLLNLLKNNLYQKFNRLIWVSPTINFDAKVLNINKNILLKNTKLENILQKENQNIEIMSGPSVNYNTLTKKLEFKESIDIDFIHNLMEEQGYIIKKYGKQVADQVLLILDDSIKNKLLKSNQFADFIFKSRHYNISIMFLSQDYFSLPKALRLNSSQIIIFSSGNRKELQQIFYENNNSVDWKMFYEIYKECIRRPFGFLNINYDNTREYRFLDGIDDFLIPNFE